MQSKLKRQLILSVGLLAIVAGCKARNSSLKEDSVEDGNGGAVAYCPTPQAEWNDRSAIFVDLLKAKQANLPVDLGAPELAVNDKVKLVLERIKIQDPTRYKTYMSWLEKYDAETGEFDHVPGVPGVGPINLPSEDCDVATLIYQEFSTVPGAKRYSYKKKYTKMLDNDSLATAKLHEMIYREAKDVGHTTPTYVSYFVQLLIADQLKSRSRDNYFYFIKKALNLPARMHDDAFPGLQFEMNGADNFYPSGNPRELIPVASSKDYFGFSVNPQARKSALRDGNVRDGWVPTKETAQFFVTSKQPKQITFYDSPYMVKSVAGGITLQKMTPSHETAVLVQGVVEFDKDFYVTEAKGKIEVQQAYMIHGGTDRSVISCSRVTFYPSGWIKSMAVNAGVSTLTDAAGQVHTLGRWDEDRVVEFDENGKFVK